MSLHESFRDRGGWYLLALILAGTIVFGAVQAPWRFSLFAISAVLGAATILATPRQSGPSAALAVTIWLFPAWIVLSLIPLPFQLVERLNPEVARLVQATWPGPLPGCDNGTLLPAPLPSWHTLSLNSLATREFLFQVVASIITFWAACAWSGRMVRRSKLALLWILCLFSGAEAFYGVWQWASGTPMVLWYQKTAYLECATGTLVNRNHFAMLLYVGIGCTLALLHAVAHQRDSNREREFGMRMLLAALLGLQTVGLLASQSRAGVFFGLIILVPGVPLVWKGMSRRTRIPLMIAVALIALPFGMMVVPPLVERLAGLRGDWSGDESRGAVVRLSPSIIARYPIFGTGGGTFARAFAHYRPGSIQGTYEEAHNDYLQILIETGAIGLGLALLPLVLAARSLWRRRGTTAAAPAPLLIALGCVVAHELIDFPLRMPSLMLLVAFLAGCWLHTELEHRPGWYRRLPWLAGLAIALPATLHAVAYLPGLNWLTPWPALAEVSNRETVAHSATFRDQKSTVALCHALEASARTQQRESGIASYAVRSARLYAAAAMSTSFSTAQRDLFHDAALRSAVRARTIDPWNTTLVREPLLGVMLQLGEVDKALEDASVVAQFNKPLGASIVDQLVTAGLPLPLIAEVAKDNEEPLKRLLQQILTDQDLESAEAIVPVSLRPTLGFCKAGGEVFGIMRDMHHASAATFLQGCRALPEVVRDPGLARLVTLWIIHDHFARGELAEAAKEIESLPPGVDRCWQEFEIARIRRDWPALVRAGTMLSFDRSRDRTEQSEAWLQSNLGLALAHTGDLPGAIRAYRKALDLDPSVTAWEEILVGLRQGIVPP